MIGGFPPFKSHDAKSTYDNILQLKINWPRNADKIAKDLISKMLVVEPEMRTSIEDIKSHVFLKDIDWDLAKSRKLDPPIVPDLEHHFSLEYFKDDEKMEMYHNPLFKFDKRSNSNKNELAKSVERKFGSFGVFQNPKVMKMLEDF